MHPRLHAAFFASLIIHGAVVYYFLKVHTDIEKEKPSVVQVEWIEPQPAGPPKGSAGSPVGKGSKISLSKLRSVMAIPGPEATALNPAKDAEARGTGEWRTEDWGRGGGNFGEIVNFMQYDRLRQEIRGLLNYPGILARRGIHGTVNTRLAFTDQSQCDWKRIKIESHERYLRVYTLTMLKKLCAFTVIKNLYANREKIIDLSFQFDVINETTPAALQHPSDFIMGNVIAFRRTTPKSMMEYQIGPIRGVWFAPAVALDFPWLIEKWDYYVNGVDPMAPFKE